MTKTDVGNLLKASLNLVCVTQTNVALDNFLNQKVDAAIGFIEREGGTFTTSEDEYAFTAEEAELIVMYATWSYKKRDQSEVMPRMLRWTLNNFIMSQKARES